MTKFDPARPFDSANLPSTDDMALCVAFVDGMLEAEAKHAFELRLAREPALAAAAQALLEADEMMRRLSAGTERKQARVRSLRPWIWAASLAAAAALFVLLGRSFWGDSLWSERAAPTFEVAVAPGFESPIDYIASRPELAGLRPPGLDVVRGDNPAPNISGDEFVAKARAVEADAQRGVADISAGYFVVPIQVADEADVLVYAFPQNGAAPTVGVEPIYAAAIAAGAHVLPSPRFAVNAKGGGNVHYERGFLVGVGAGELDVVVAVRTRSHVAQEPPRCRDAASAERELVARGFAVRHLRVREPG